MKQALVGMSLALLCATASAQTESADTVLRHGVVITVDPQDSWSDGNVLAIDEGMAFSPWHGIAAHRPLGSIMRVRKTTYEASAEFRGRSNGCPIHEPRS